MYIRKKQSTKKRKNKETRKSQQYKTEDQGILKNRKKQQVDQKRVQGTDLPKTIKEKYKGNKEIIKKNSSLREVHTIKSTYFKRKVRRNLSRQRNNQLAFINQKGKVLLKIRKKLATYDTLIRKNQNTLKKRKR